MKMDKKNFRYLLITPIVLFTQEFCLSTENEEQYEVIETGGLIEFEVPTGPGDYDDVDRDVNPGQWNEANDQN